MSFVRIWAVVTRHWIVLRRAPHRWFEISFWPVMDVVLWGSLGAYVAKQASSVDQVKTGPLLAGITMFWVFTQAQFSIALGFNEETWTRNLLNVLTTPIREIEYVAGIALFGLVKLVLCISVLSVTTWGLFDFTIGSVGWSAIPIGALLVLNGWAIGLLGVGLILRFGQSAEILIWGINYMFLSMSGVFFPVSTLPAGFRLIGSVLPPSMVFTQLRRASVGTGATASGLLWAAAASLLFLALASAFARGTLRVFRARGFVTRYS